MERKHRTQMSSEEIVFTETLIHNLNGVIDDEHVRDRMKQKKVTEADIVNTLKWGNVIEVNSLSRVVMRLNTGKRKGVVVVIDPSTQAIVTVWYNSPKDRHDTLDKSLYTWKVNLIEFLKGRQ